MALAILLTHLKTLYRRQLEIDAEVNAAEREIFAVEEASTAVPTTPRRARPRPATGTSSGTSSPPSREMARATLAAMRELGAGQPVTKRDLAARLGLSTIATTHRLRRLRASGFVVRIGRDRYQVVKEVPPL